MKPNYRCCVSCRKVAHKDEFFRIVRLHPSHKIQLHQGIGRSAYLCPSYHCLKLAQKKNKLGRSLKTKVPETTYQNLQQQLTQISAPPSDLTDNRPTS